MPSLNNSLVTIPINTLYLPLQMDGLLVPDITVAEIFCPECIAEKHASPDWFIGTINWRGRVIPLVSFDSLNGATTIAADQVERVAVLNGLADHGHLPYYAIALNGQAEFMSVTDDDLEIHEGRPRGRAEAMSIAVKAKTGGIPNIEWVEQHLLAYTLHTNTH